VLTFEHAVKYSPETDIGDADSIRDVITGVMSYDDEAVRP
jgi:hypothetical protein